MAPLPPSTKPFTTSQTGSDLESRLAALEKVIQVEKDGSVTIKSATAVTIEAGTQLKIKAGVGADIQANSQIRIKANATLELWGSGTTDVKGSSIRLNGGRPVARVGDPVINGMIVTGNPTVLA